MSEVANELVFVPLGGLGEIGMNFALYGFGPKTKRKWIAVDCGLAFAGPEHFGIDLILPNPAFIEKLRQDLVAIIVTHAHEDHIGALPDLWPRLGCPIYATRFAASLLEAKRLAEPGAPDVPLLTVDQGEVLRLDPFTIEFIPMAHSIPESCALAIRTEAGTLIHSGDWKIDAEPGLGKETDAKRLTEIGDEGVLALISDSTNILREGISPSEGDVARALRDIILNATGRVIVTTFASNVARIRAVAEAAMAARRNVVLVGRAMERVVGIARDLGYLDGIPLFLSMDAYPHLPRDKVVVLATGSQGESRAAIARIAEGEHQIVNLSPGDQVIFSSRTIPGNERDVGRIINQFIRAGVEVITDRNALVHASGHPRRGEVEQLYRWVRPKIAVPAHGEEIHLAEHARFALEHGAEQVVRARNGDLVVLAPGQAAIIGEVPSGRLYKDGNSLIKADDDALRARQKLAFSGIVTIGMAITAKGDLAGVPDVVIAGMPGRTQDGAVIDAVVDEALFQTFDHLPRQKRRDADLVSSAIEKAVRNAVAAAWGKKPAVHVLVIEV
ncbi:ribonuclease J [Beijerinckia indica]|uniref:Beta-lactamase domain protein n=1 Tax=Beijerinckia indica subsp. indica (strain ATCC 9039 / DSM 1715 / NCIMB 8712) TaxID=395963 RepID=B2IHV1_BEII9|nr:ribonuclease J [Beijerinckia indica]ACB95994.1 beta-lactamase domain protein [Beijerinckia indica subsp. indica ATCC 9039]